MIDFMYDRGLLVVFYEINRYHYGRIINMECQLNYNGCAIAFYDIDTGDGRVYSINEKDIMVCYRQVAEAVDEIVRI